MNKIGWLTISRIILITLTVINIVYSGYCIYQAAQPAESTNNLAALVVLFGLPHLFLLLGGLLGLILPGVSGLICLFSFYPDFPFFFLMGSSFLSPLKLSRYMSFGECRMTNALANLAFVTGIMAFHISSFKHWLKTNP